MRKTNRDVSTAAAPTAPRKRRVVAWVAALLVSACGIWARAWFPTQFFAVAFLAWWVSARKAAPGPDAALARRATAPLWEATASIAGAAAVGFAAVIGLVTLLNVYSGITPSEYPDWLPALQDRLVALSAWFQLDENKTLIALVYISLVLICIFVAAVARRHNKEWRPVRTLGAWKQYLTKAVVALQAFTFFTFFAQAPVKEYFRELERNYRWQYGVAKRAEERAVLKRLLAEEFTTAVKSAPENEDEERELAAAITRFGEAFKAANPVTPPDERNDNSKDGSDDPNHLKGPSGPDEWRPTTWPHPPADYLKLVVEGKTPAEADYRPSWAEAASGPRKSSSDQSKKEPKHQAVVTKQVEDANPIADLGPRPDINAWAGRQSGLPKSIESVESLREMRSMVEATVAGADTAERRYGEAIKGLLEVVCEYAGLVLTANPWVEAYVDEILNATADRVYDFAVKPDPPWRSKMKSFFGRLLAPRETAAKKLRMSAIEFAKANNPQRAREHAITLAQTYPTTKAAVGADKLIEEYTFQWVKSLYAAEAWEEMLMAGNEYLEDYGGWPRATVVRGMGASAQRQLDAQAVESERQEIRDALDEIFGGDYGELPQATDEGFSGTEDVAELSVTNSTPFPLTLFYDGPDVKKVELPAGRTTTFKLRSGAYRIGASVGTWGSGVQAYAGRETLTSSTYSVRYYLKRIR